MNFFAILSLTKYFISCLVLISFLSFSLQYKFKNIAEAAILNDEVTYNQFLDRIYNSSSQYKLIFIFTSWCSFCKKAFSDMLYLNEQLINGELDIVFLSLDTRPEKLHLFMNKITNFNVDIYNFQSTEDVLRTFMILKIKYRGKIPHFVLLDEKNKIVFDGNNIKLLYHLYLHDLIDTYALDTVN